jgi:release factor glutamine methyltransferase
MPELAESRRSLIEEAAALLRRAGLPEPRRQATRLCLELQNSGPGARLDLDRPVESEEAISFRVAVRRLSTGEPLAHVTGWTGFRHLILRSDRRALIPRPETEGLVEVLLSRIQEGTVADVGTGSGCIALSLAREGNFRRIVAVDLSADALALAGLNADLAGVRGSVDFVQADFTAALGNHSLDALISNPPYLTESEYLGLDQSVRDWEPGMALQSGADGLEATNRLLRDGLRVVRPGGWLVLEVDCNRADSLARRASRHGWCEVSIQVDLFGRERYLLGRRSDRR